MPHVDTYFQHSKYEISVTDLAGKITSELSGGIGPKITILNRPFSVDVDLDPDVRVICRDFIRGVCGRKL